MVGVGMSAGGGGRDDEREGKGGETGCFRMPCVKLHQDCKCTRGVKKGTTAQFVALGSLRKDESLQRFLW